MTELSDVEKKMLETWMPDCPVSFSVGKLCPGQPCQPKPTKRFEVGSTMPLTFQWPAPDNWLARVSQWLARLLYKVGIHWQNRWGRWRMNNLEAEGEVIQGDEAGWEWRVTSGALTEGGTGSFAEMERLADD